MDLFKYRVWCETENGWVETDFRTSEPTVCPNNSEHIINTNLTTIISRNVQTLPTNPFGILKTQSTPRPPGTNTIFVSRFDDPEDIYDIGGGQFIEFVHNIGDPTVTYKYYHINGIYNTTYVRSGYVIPKDAQRDYITYDVIPTQVECNVGVMPTVFSGTGLDDCTSGGVNNATSCYDVLIEITSTGTPDTFKWSLDNGNTWVQTNAAITGVSQSLQDGITITFTATTGHTVGDQWSFRAVDFNQPYALYPVNSQGYSILPSSVPGTIGNVEVLSIVDGNIPWRGGLCESPVNSDGIRPPAFWTATWDDDTHTFLNVTAAPYGNGTHNMFWAPGNVDFPVVIFVDCLLYENHPRSFSSDDISALGDGYIIRVRHETRGTDHNWSLIGEILVYREKTL